MNDFMVLNTELHFRLWLSLGIRWQIVTLGRCQVANERIRAASRVTVTLVDRSDRISITVTMHLHELASIFEHNHILHTVQQWMVEVSWASEGKLLFHL